MNLAQIFSWGLYKLDCITLSTGSTVCDYKVNLYIDIYTVERLFVDLVFIFGLIFLVYKIFVVWVRKYFEH
jgi:hypothetical protein